MAIYHKDWFVRQIEIAIRTIALLIFNRKEISYEILDENRQSEADKLFLQLSMLLDGHKINEAENLLYTLLDTDDRDYFAVAVDFYSRLNKMSDDELELGNFSREEVMSGLEDVKKLYGVSI